MQIRKKRKENKSMKKRTILYIAISVFCVIAIGAGMYYQIFVAGEEQFNEIGTQNEVDNPLTQGQTQEELKTEFNNLFDNNFYDQGYDTSFVQKIAGHEEQPLVYAAYNIQEEQDEKYSVNINLPVFNIDGEIAAEFNNTTQTIFANKANDVLNNAQVYTIYDVNYVAYVNDTILSLIIKSTLKEGNNPQRVIVQTYNYNLSTGEKVILNDVLTNQGYDTKEVNEQIDNVVRKAAEDAEAISQAAGQTIYQRDPDNAMYVTDNVNNFFLGENGMIYIIYAYGNNNYTSEMDIIKLA